MRAGAGVQRANHGRTFSRREKRHFHRPGLPIRAGRRYRGRGQACAWSMQGESRAVRSSPITWSPEVPGVVARMAQSLYMGIDSAFSKRRPRLPHPALCDFFCRSSRAAFGRPCAPRPASSCKRSPSSWLRPSPHRSARYTATKLDCRVRLVTASAPSFFLLLLRGRLHVAIPLPVRRP